MAKLLFKEQIEFLLILLLAAVLFFTNIWGYDLWAPDEPRYAEIAREMIEEGNWIVPHDNGWVSTEKPPLLFWLISIFSVLSGGVSSFAARLPAVCAGLGTVAVLYILCLRLFGKRTAILSAIVLTTSYLFFDNARTAQTDMLLTLFIILSFFLFYRSQGGLPLRRRSLLLFYCVLALGTLTKGPVGFVIPLGVIVLYLASVGEMRRVKEIYLTEGVLLFLIIVGGWVAAATFVSHGEYGFFSAMNSHVIERYAGGLHHKQPFYYFIATLPLDFLPWSLFIPASLSFFVSRLKSIERKETAFVLCWFFFIFVFFTFSTEKRNLYILPLFPAISIIVGHCFRAVIDDAFSVPGRLAAAFNYFLSGLFFVAGFSLPMLTWIRAKDYFMPALILGTVIIILTFFAFRTTLKQGWLKGTVLSYVPLFLGGGVLLPAVSKIFYPGFFLPAILMGTICIIGSFALFFENRRAFSVRVPLIIAMTASSFYLAAVLFAFPIMNDYKSVRKFGETVSSTVKEYLKEGERLPIYKSYRSSYVFYSGFYLDVVQTADELERMLNSKERKFCLISEADLLDASEKLTVPVYRIYLEDIRHGSMILISNRP